MKAIVWTKYGPPDVLQLREVEKPTPGDNEILIRIRATTVPSGDCEMRSLSGAFWYALPLRAYLGLRRPERKTILGMELAGEVESVGRDVSRFKVGDPVFAATGFAGMGTYAEYVCLPLEPEDGALAIKPANMSYEEAAAVPIGAMEALCFLRQGNIQPGQKVLVNGAGGTIGTFAVQLAKHFGAEVTGVDSTDKLDMLREIGADHVVDYAQEDFTRSGETYDFVLDVVGRISFSGRTGLLKPGGRYLLANPRPLPLLRGQLAPMTGGRKAILGSAHLNTEDLIFLRDLIEAGKLKSVIDRCYPLERTAEAHRYVETGRKKGHVVISVARPCPGQQAAQP